MSNHCLYCGVEIPLMGKTGRPKKYCDDRTHKGKHTNAKKYMTPEQVQAAKDDFGQMSMHEWAKKHLTDSKGRYRPKIFEKEFCYCVGITEMVSQLSKLIEAHKGNDKLELHRDQFNAYVNQSEPEPCIECGGEVSFSGNDGVWRKLCSSACNQANMKSQHRNPTGISDPIKAAATKEERYGDAKYNGSDHNRKKLKQDHIPQDSLDKLADKEWMLNALQKLPTYALGNQLGCSSSLVQKWAARHGIELNTRQQTSFLETLIIEHLNTVGVHCIQSYRPDWLKGKEIDIYIPEHNVGIEMNGSYWHSEKFDETNTRHQDKWKLCMDNGVKLMQFYEYDVQDRLEVILSMIGTACGLNRRIYARSTTIKKVTSKETKPFLDENHFQKSTAATNHYGLYDGDELVMVATFSPYRFDKTGRDDRNELVRLATKANTTVVGGASKLLKAAIIELGKPIISFSRNDYSDGNLYEKLGFVKSHITKPSYVWWRKGTVLSRYQTMKHKLPELFGNVEGTEVEIMQAHGFKRIFNAGNTCYVLD